MKIHKLKCLVCGDIIQSMYVHDFKECKCRQCFIDGGLEYCRYGAKDFDKIELIEEEVSDD